MVVQFNASAKLKLGFLVIFLFMSGLKMMASILNNEQ